MRSIVIGKCLSAKNVKLQWKTLPNNEMRVYYQINYTLTEVPEDAAYFHAQFRRSNPNINSDHVLVDGN